MDDAFSHMCPWPNKDPLSTNIEKTQLSQKKSCHLSPETQGRHGHGNTPLIAGAKPMLSHRHCGGHMDENWDGFASDIVRIHHLALI